nr:hypothetical protein [Tanacetum cinerariifolium]
MMPSPGFSTPPHIPNVNTNERPPVTTTVFAATTLKNTPFAYRASTLTDPSPMISPTFVEANYEILESLLKDIRRQIRTEDLRTELEEGSRTKRNIEGNRPSKVGAEENERREMNLLSLLAARLGRSENGQTLQSSLTSVHEGRQSLINIGGNLPLNDMLLSHHVQPFIPSSVHVPNGFVHTHVDPYSQPSVSTINGQTLSFSFQAQTSNPSVERTSVYPPQGGYPFHTQPMYAEPNMPMCPSQYPAGLFADPTGSVTPFVRWIEDYPLLDGRKMPSHAGSYDGKGDPDNFLHLFEVAIRMQKWLMHVACYMFTYTLKDSARIYWISQKAGSILNYEDLKAKFRSHFSQQKRFTKTHLAVYSIKQREGESVRAFATRVEEGRFSGHLITKQRIKADPSKVKVISDLQSPKSVSEIQSLDKKLATIEADEAFRRMKELLEALSTVSALVNGKTLIVSLASSKESTSAILMAERGKKQVPMYFASQTLYGAELEYPKLEKLILALVYATRKLRRYFQAHLIQVLSDKPIKQILDRIDVGQPKRKRIHLCLKIIRVTMVKMRRSGTGQEHHPRGPLPMAPRGARFLVVAIDYFIKWVEAKPLISTTDKHMKRFVWEIVKGMECRLRKTHQGWVDELPQVLWAHKTTPKSSNEETPFSLVYGSEAIIPIKISVETRRIHDFNPKKNQKRYGERPRHPRRNKGDNFDQRSSL